jgi:endonuclease YncB( thermonuclease family)
MRILLFLLLLATPALAAQIPMCGSGPRITCVVDGDTVWVAGVKYRFEEIDTPEKGGLAECMQEGLLAIEAANRLAEILSTNEFTIVATGRDRYGRTLAHFMIGNRSAGEILIAEALGRRWRGRTERWCE